jgi:hypothetical protein
MSAVVATEYLKRLSGNKLQELHRETIEEIKEYRNALTKKALFLELIAGEITRRNKKNRRKTISTY